MIKSELGHILCGKKDDIILKNIIRDYKIQILEDNKKYLNDIGKLCKKAYENTKHTQPTIKKIRNNISKMNRKIKKAKENHELLIKEWKKSNVVLDGKIKKAKKHYNALTKLMEQMKNIQNMR